VGHCYVICPEVAGNLEPFITAVLNGASYPQMNPNPDPFALALQYRRSGDLPQAERLLRQVVASNASHTEAWRELGLTCLDTGKMAEAEECFQNTLRLAPAYAASHSDLGIALAQQQKLDQAAESFRQAVRLQPNLAAAHNNLGLVLMWQGRLDEAIASVRRAIDLNPRFADAHNNLGLALAARGQVFDAVDCYRQALRCDPNHANAQTNLNRALGPPPPPVPREPDTETDAASYNVQGDHYFREGRLADAIAAFQAAVRVHPTYADAHGNLGNVYFYQGRYDEATASYRRALELNPTSGIFYTNLGAVLVHQQRFTEAEAACREAVRFQPEEPGAHNNLGNAQQSLGKNEEAAASYREALRLNPSFPEAHHNLGLVLMEQKKAPEAIERYREAIRLKPDYADAYASLATALVDQEKTDEGMAAAQQALRLQPSCVPAHCALGVAYLARECTSAAMHCFEEALLLKPDFAHAHCSRGVALLTQNRAREALAAFDQALRIKPEHADARFGRSLTNLVLGDLGPGFEEYEWRTKCRPFFGTRKIDGPVWTGSPLEGRTILLYAEQGLGDTLQFVRYAALVKQMGATVIVECQPSVVRLLKRTEGIDRLIGQGSPLPPYDVHASLLSLPAILHTTSSTVPVGAPYVMADEGLVQQWRQALSSEPGFRVGICWQGNQEHKRDRLRSIPLRQFEPLARLEGVRLISLQVGHGLEQMQELAGSFQVADWSDKLNDFMDTASLMKNLDLVITVDTSPAHLAGALGVPVWVILPFSPDWRWQLEREDNPWYPTMRLFRPREPMKWDEVFQRIVPEMQKLLNPGVASQAP
jgi:tetratricopeptide (TPR) repeat protein